MAQEAAQEEVDEAEFAAASAAVSRLTEVFSPSRVLQPSLAAQVCTQAMLWILYTGARAAALSCQHMCPSGHSTVKCSVMCWHLLRCGAVLVVIMSWHQMYLGVRRCQM